MLPAMPCSQALPGSLRLALAAVRPTVAAIFARVHNVRPMWLAAKEPLASTHAALADVLRKSLVAGKFSAGPVGFVS